MDAMAEKPKANWQATLTAISSILSVLLQFIRLFHT